MWSLLIHKVKQKIENQEYSGHGEGGGLFLMARNYMEEPRTTKPSFGELSNCSRRALDLCSSFFRDKKSNVFYLWEVLDCNNLMVLSMQRLENSVAATTGELGIHSVTGDKTKGDKSSITTGGETSEGHDKHNKKVQQLSKTYQQTWREGSFCCKNEG